MKVTVPTISPIQLYKRTTPVSIFLRICKKMYGFHVIHTIIGSSILTLIATLAIAYMFGVKHIPYWVIGAALIYFVLVILTYHPFVRRTLRKAGVTIDSSSNMFSNPFNERSLIEISMNQYYSELISHGLIDSFTNERKQVQHLISLCEKKKSETDYFNGTTTASSAVFIVCGALFAQGGDYSIISGFILILWVLAISLKSDINKNKKDLIIKTIFYLQTIEHQLRINEELKKHMKVNNNDDKTTVNWYDNFKLLFAKFIKTKINNN